MSEEDKSGLNLKDATSKVSTAALREFSLGGNYD